MKTFFHPNQLLHHPQSYFSRGKMRAPQEVPDRARALVAAAQAIGFAVKVPADHGMEPLAAVHDPAYLRFLQTAHADWKAVGEDWGEEVMSNIFVQSPNAGRGVLALAALHLADGSCPIGPQTWEAAYWSAQSAVSGAEAILSGEPAAWALCRPPGHHARAAAAGGFCYLNNAAIAAQVLRRGFDRVAILDPDMHHGQGVQEIFYDRGDVLYVSIHGDPTNFYPATAGFADERGAGAGLGANLNLPMPHSSPEDVFFARLEVACAAVTAFGAGTLVVALGFDIYALDPQAKVSVTTQGFHSLGARVRSLSLPVLIVQEGGYHIESLEQNARAFFGGLEGKAWN